MSTYLAAMRPLVLLIERDERRILLDQTNFAVKGPVGAVGSDLLTMSVRATRVTAPTALASSHSEFIGGVRIEGNAFKRYASKRPLAVTTEEQIAAVTKWLSGTLAGRELQASWRDELVAQLRRAGLAVPLWLKTFAGKPAP